MNAWSQYLLRQLNTALIVHAITIKLVLLVLIPSLQMVSAMMRQTMLTAIMMEVTAVYMTPILITALIVHAITMKLVLLVLIP